MPDKGMDGDIEGLASCGNMCGNMRDIMVANQRTFAMAGHIECGNTIAEARDARGNPPP
jgi:hypothetical protein